MSSVRCENRLYQCRFRWNYIYESPRWFQPTPPCYALKLNKSISGLKQSGLNWHMCVSKFLISIGFSKLLSDSCILYLSWIMMGENTYFGCLLLFRGFWVLSKLLFARQITHLRSNFRWTDDALSWYLEAMLRSMLHLVEKIRHRWR